MVGVGLETRSRMMVGVGTRPRMMEADVRGLGAGQRVLEAGGVGPVVLLVVEGDGELTVNKGNSGCLAFDGRDVEASGSVIEGGGEGGGDGGGEGGGEGGEEGGEELFGDDGEVVGTLIRVVVGTEESGGDVESVGLGVEATREDPAAAAVGLGPVCRV